MQTLHKHDRDGFVRNANILIKKMEEALEKLKDDGYIPFPYEGRDSFIFSDSHPAHLCIQVRRGGKYKKKGLFFNRDKLDVEIIEEDGHHGIIRFKKKKKGGEKE